jgi:tRNA threonylcarbamoyladenosine biosynthesis protein TsaB
MGLILSIETAISVCSVALHSEGKLVAVLELHQDNVHSQKLMPAIESLMKNAGIEMSGLDAIAVSAGPGSYTGLRIGVSTAKGLAYAQDIPLIAVDTLDALARSLKGMVEGSDLIVPMMDARRMEVYCKTLNARMEEVQPLQPLVVEEGSFAEQFEQGRLYFIGDAVEKIQTVIQHPNARFISRENTAITIGELAAEKFLSGNFVDIAYFEPNYLKEFKVIKSKKNPLLS